MSRYCYLLLLVACFPLDSRPAFAEEGIVVPAIDNPATLKECGACHFAFPPQMLPARSWKKLMVNLKSHFGEDASLPEATRADITAYMVSHAADAPTTENGQWFLRGLPDNATPLRITEMPFWRRGHEEVPRSYFTNPQVKTASNCMACHQNNGEGTGGDED